MPGSDFPVLLSVESYKRTFEYIKESRLPGQEIEKILYGNALALFDFDAVHGSRQPGHHPGHP